MQVDELLPYLRENQETLIQEIRNGKYKPNPVRRVEIPKETKGEFRKLGFLQLLTELFNRQLHRNSRQSSRNSFRRIVLVSDQKEERMMRSDNAKRM